MKRLSLQWRITLMSVLLIGITCVAMNLLLCSSGVYYMDTIADSLQGGGTVILNDGGAASFDPQLIAPNEELTIVVDGVQGRFRTTNWYITAAVTLLSGILAYFVSGRALKPLRSFTSQVEQVQLNNLADMRIDEDAISEFRQLSRSFNQMLERLNNAFAAQRQFTGNAAHELRTPMTTIKGFIDGMLDGTIPPDMQNHYLQLVSEETGRLARLIQNMLDLSKLESGEYQVNARMFNIWETLTGVALSAEQRINDGMIDIDGLTMDEKVLVYADPDLIHQVAYNLLDNAIKYSAPGGRITVKLWAGEYKAFIEFIDQGRGIPPEDLENVKTKFYKGSNSVRGSGIGLALVDSIMTALDGTMDIKSTLGRGTVVTLGLPLYKK